MKFIPKYSIAGVVIIGCLIFSSYYYSSLAAKDVIKDINHLSPLKGHLILFIDNDFKPCWLFKAQHKTLITGGTFDIYVSLLGRIINVPSSQEVKPKK